MLCVVQLRWDDFYRGPIVVSRALPLRPSVETEQTGCLRSWRAAPRHGGLALEASATMRREPSGDLD